MDPLGGYRQAQESLEKRAKFSAQRASRDVRLSERVFYNGIIGSADFERTLARADVQAGLAMQITFQDQLPDEFQFCLRAVSAHDLFAVGQAFEPVGLKYLVTIRYRR